MGISATVSRLIFFNNTFMNMRRRGGKEANVQTERGGVADVQTDGRQRGGGEDRWRKA